jgi:5-methyltetrahydrofolate--homocysteine methyltransferase
VIYEGEDRKNIVEVFHFLRQQKQKSDGGPYLSLCDFIAPKEAGVDYIGGFITTIGKGVESWADELAAKKDDYSSIMVKALGDRCAEALTELAHKWIRETWRFGLHENLSLDDLIKEKYQGIRPAPGYPACPDHTEKDAIWRLLDAEKNTGVKLTENYAMTPVSSVSGLYFAHPSARYFRVGNVIKDQIVHYAARKKMSVSEIQRWLAPNLGYDPS